MMKTVMTTASATLQLGNVILQMMKEPNYIDRLGILINTVNEQITPKGARSICDSGQTAVYTSHKT